MGSMPEWLRLGIALLVLLGIGLLLVWVIGAFLGFIVKLLVGSLIVIGFVALLTHAGVTGPARGGRIR
jgi:hypothetical protein